MRTLLESELPSYRDHLLRLDADDRRLRFGYAIDDRGIDAHVRGFGPRTDRILALLDDGGAVVGAAHIALLSGVGVELAFSVDRDWRGRGLCRVLFERALEFARNRGIRRVHLTCLSDNKAMRTLARAFGMTQHAEAGEVNAELMLPPPTPFGVLKALAAEQAALWPTTLWPATLRPAELWPAGAVVSPAGHAYAIGVASAGNLRPAA